MVQLQSCDASKDGIGKLNTPVNFLFTKIWNFVRILTKLFDIHTTNFTVFSFLFSQCLIFLKTDSIFKPSVLIQVFEFQYTSIFEKQKYFQSLVKRKPNFEEQGLSNAFRIRIKNKNRPTLMYVYRCTTVKPSMTHLNSIFKPVRYYVDYMIIVLNTQNTCRVN